MTKKMSSHSHTEAFKTTSHARFCTELKDFLMDSFEHVTKSESFNVTRVEECYSKQSCTSSLKNRN